MDLLLEALLYLSSVVPESWRPYVIGGLFVWGGFSLAVSKVNGWLRKRTEEGGAALPGWAQKALAVANVVALNPDKGHQLWTSYKGRYLPASK